MGYVNIREHLEVPPQVAFDLAADPKRVPEWQTMVVEVTNADPRLDHVGAKYDARLKIAGRQLDSTWEVTKVSPPRSLRLRGTSPDGGVATVWLTFGAWEGGCEFIFEIDYELPGGFVANIADKLFVERAIARELRHAMANFKAIVEHEAETAGG